MVQWLVSLPSRATLVKVRPANMQVGFMPKMEVHTCYAYNSQNCLHQQHKHTKTKQKNSHKSISTYPSLSSLVVRYLLQVCHNDLPGADRRCTWLPCMERSADQLCCLQTTRWHYPWGQGQARIHTGKILLYVYYLLGKGGYAFGSVGLSVWLFVDITHKVMNGFGWNFMEGSWVVQWRTDLIFVEI